MSSLILDFDESVGPLPGATRLDMRHWCDSLRFACSYSQLHAFGDELAARSPLANGPVFFGSGDFHHLSLPLIERASAGGPLRVLVFDNHPDNMRFPFGVHCGSWVSRVAALPNVCRVDVVGITSSDISLAHAFENRLSPLYSGSLRYWSIGVDTAWAARVKLQSAFLAFDSAGDLMSALLAELRDNDLPVYLSIDKDVLDPSEASTNWDQGCLSVSHLQTAIARVKPRLIGSDVNGEVSIARYPQLWKRLLTTIDKQRVPNSVSLAAMQEQQHSVNLALMQAFA